MLFNLPYRLGFLFCSLEFVSVIIFEDVVNENIILLLTGIRVIASVLFSETPTIVTVIQLLLPELSVNKCFIIPNSIRYYDIIKRHRTCSPCLLLSSTSMVSNYSFVCLCFTDTPNYIFLLYLSRSFPVKKICS
jgi:hypothetical protein